MRFEYFRFLLTPLEPEGSPFDGTPPSREELIKEVFSGGQEYLFTSGKAAYGLVINYSDHGMVHAKMGKKVTRRITKSPAENFETEQVDDWPDCPVFINISDEKETGRTRDAGQLIAFGVSRHIRSPYNCLRAFAAEINESLVSKGYYLSINPIPSEEKNFWEVVKEYEGQIKKVVLTYTPPNIFNLENSLEDDLRDANEKFNITSAQIVFENKIGSVRLPEDNQLLRQTAEYIELGNGTYRLHLSDGRTIKSEGGIKHETFDGIRPQLESDNPADIEIVIRIVLGKGQEND